MLETLAAGAKILGGIGGLFGKKKSTLNETVSGIRGQAKGARWAADEWGFSPLTLLGNSSAIAGGGYETPPLASIQSITDGIQGIDDVVSGETNRQKERSELQNQLLRLEVERLNAGGAGGMAAQRLQIDGGAQQAGDIRVSGPAMATDPNAWFGKPPYDGARPAAPGRETDVKPVDNSAGYGIISNAFTNALGGELGYIGNDGEPWDLLQLGAVGLQALPQIAIRNNVKAVELLAEGTRWGIDKASDIYKKNERKDNFRNNYSGQQFRLP